MATRSGPWIRDYPELLICFEFRIIANSRRERVGNGLLFFKDRGQDKTRALGRSTRQKKANGLSLLSSLFVWRMMLRQTVGSIWSKNKNLRHNSLEHHIQFNNTNNSNDYENNNYNYYSNVAQNLRQQPWNWTSTSILCRQGVSVQVFQIFSICVFSLQAKHMIMLRDSVIQDIVQFLEHCEGREWISKNRLKWGKICKWEVLQWSIKTSYIRTNDTLGERSLHLQGSLKYSRFNG